MSFALAIYYFTKRNVQALPIPTADIVQSFSFPPFPPSSCNDLHSCRSIWNIIWSCLATIISCIWVSVHPDIPYPSDGWFTTGLVRVITAMMALLAPEFIIMEAMIERFSAKKSVQIYKYHGWTKAHGFFLEMGGFVLYRDGKAIKVLGLWELKKLADTGAIDFPTITEEEIEDKSKGDILSKGLVVLQTGWFILQCVARGVERLPITALEIVTLAFAILNLMTYLLWWNKPLNVRCAVRILDKRRTANVEEEEAHTWMQRLKAIQTRMSFTLDPYVDSADAATIAIPFFLITTIFGAIHCIAWSFDFPSQKDQFLWRVSCIAVISLPVCFLFIGLLLRRSKHFAIRTLTSLALIICMILYFLARIILLFIPCESLKTLPPGAYQTVQWTNFIPHI